MERRSPPRPAAPVFVLVLAALAAALAGCALSGHAITPSELGAASSAAELERLVETPGPLTVETVVSADWEVDLGGLLDLDHPRAQAAGLEDRPEPIQIYFHVIRHPTRGVFLVDTGVERALRDAPDEASISWLVKAGMHLEKLRVHTALGDLLAREPARLAGVFLTHLHLDHILGVPDLPAGTPLYAGPGETSARSVLHLVVSGSTDRVLEGKPALREWAFRADPTGTFDGVVDVFGDGSLFAISVPGHTAGSTAYLARTTTGPVLLVGDTCHTSFGWEHGVPPGSFTADGEGNARSLEKLRALVAAHPSIDVRLGHQPLARR